MLTSTAFVERKRREAWDLGIALREHLVAEYMRREGLQERPFLKEIIDELLIDILEVRLRTDVLPLDTYAQTEFVRGRAEVTINSRIDEMSGVKDTDGVVHVAKWHEGDHVVRDRPAHGDDGNEQEGLVILCRGFNRIRTDDRACEFRAENAAKAAAIAGADLERCMAYRDFRFLAANRGDLDRNGRWLLLQIAALIGVNRTALFTYFEQRGWFCWQGDGRHRRMMPNPTIGSTALRIA